MNWTLLRRDPAVAMAIRMLGVAVAIPILLLLLALCGIRPLGGSELTPEFVISLGGMLVVFNALACFDRRHRYLEYTMTLPLSGPELVRTRASGLIALGLACVWAPCVVAILLGLGPRAVAIGAKLTAAVVCLNLWTYAIRPDDTRVLRDSIGALWLLAYLASVVAVLSHPLAARAALALAVVALVRLIRGAPVSLTMPVGWTRRRTGAGPRELSVGALLRRETVWKPILLFMVVLGALLGFGVLQAPVVVLVAPVMLLSHMRSVMPVLAFVGHLPVSRTRVFPYVALPAAAALVIGGVVGMNTFTSLPAGVERKLVIDKNLRHVAISVPGEYWRHQFGTGAVTLRGPDSETFRPPQHTVIPWLWSCYNPYAVGPESSPAFVATQLQRAYRDVHGAEYPLEIFATRVERGRLPRTTGLPYRRNDKVLLALLFVAAWLLSMKVLKRGWATLGYVGWPILIVLVLTRPKGLLVMCARAYYGLGALLPGPALWAVVAAVALGAYALGARWFARIDVPQRRVPDGA